MKLNLFIAISFLSLFSSNLSASAIKNSNDVAHGELKNILRYALKEDPRILEAKANSAAAEMQTKVAKAGHFPTLSVTNTQILTQRHKNDSDSKKSRPALKGNVNLFSWGRIQSEIESSRYKENFFKFKQEETKEQIGKSIAEYYLMALQAKEMIVAYQDSLLRHQKILNKLNSMAHYDEGRAFEIDEAQSRLLQVEASIEEQSRILDLALSRLNRFTNKPITEKDIKDPFQDEAELFISYYKNKQFNNNPTYLAQLNELESVKKTIEASKAKLLPAVNLQGELYRGGYEVYLDVSWNFLDLAASRSVDQQRFSENAAQAKLQEILLDLQEQARSAEIDMRKNSQRLKVTHKQINTQKKVVSSVELQFDIAKRSLLDVLNAYRELSSIQLSEINIKNDYRLASLSYLISQANVAKWAGIETVHLKF